MIAAISWVPKGAAKSVPTAVEPPSKEEIEEILKNDVLGTDIDGDMENDDEDEDEDEGMDVGLSKQDEEIAHALVTAEALGKGSKSTNTESDSIADAFEKLDMDNYDEEDDDVDLFGAGLPNLYYPNNEMDPYLKDKDDDDSEELEDMTIKPEDAVIVCARNEDDVSHLEVWILEDSEGDSNVYVHHDIIIPAFPLCVAWLDCPLKGGEQGNFIAVGSMDPAIEIWDLDIMDEVQPSAVLGGIVEKKKKKKGNKKSIKYKDDSHTDSVLGLAWNKEYRNVLASASADKLVKIWDVATEKCNITMDHHTDKVQAVAWNHFVPQVLLSGSFDRSVVMKDGRIPSHNGLKWSVAADVESLAWVVVGVVTAVAGVDASSAARLAILLGTAPRAAAAAEDMAAVEAAATNVGRRAILLVIAQTAIVELSWISLFCFISAVPILSGFAVMMKYNFTSIAFWGLVVFFGYYQYLFLKSVFDQKKNVVGCLDWHDLNS